MGVNICYDLYYDTVEETLIKNTGYLFLECDISDLEKDY